MLYSNFNGQKVEEREEEINEKKPHNSTILNGFNFCMS